MDGRTDGRTGGRAGGRANGRIDRNIVVFKKVNSCKNSFRLFLKKSNFFKAQSTY